MPGRVYLTRPIPGAGPRTIARVAEVRTAPQDEPMPAAALRQALRSADPDAVICMLHDKIDATIFDAAPRCKVFANYAVGHNNIDSAEATKRGIMITNTPGVLTEATADIAWTLILAVARLAIGGDAVMRAEAFPGWGPNYMVGGDVSGQTLGIVGPGRIATAVAERAKGFRMPILYHGRRDRPELDALGATKVDLDTLLTESDFVSLHVPLTPETNHMIDARAIKLMKPTAYLINTSRGPVIDEAALVAALQNRTIAGAGLDVYEREPAMAAGLADCKNAVLLPHLGSATVRTRAEMSDLVAANVLAALEGRRPESLVNPEVWPAGQAAPMSR